MTTEPTSKMTFHHTLNGYTGWSVALRGCNGKEYTRSEGEAATYDLATKQADEAERRIVRIYATTRKD